MRFKNNGKSYNYRSDNVVWLNNPQWFFPGHCKVYIRRKPQNNIREILMFADGYKNYWRIIYNNGYVVDGGEDKIMVAVSCLEEDETKNTLSYLKDVALVNPLGKDSDSDGILAKMYEALDFVDVKTAAACFLNPKQHQPKALKHSDLIYPFGCNMSQKRAVEAAFEHQVSVIQGPPGTGKTQTILNIIANIVRQEKTVLVVSNNNSATTNVLEKLQKYGIAFIVAPLGSRENKERFIANQPVTPLECNTWNLSITELLNNKHNLQCDGNCYFTQRFHKL